MRIHLISCPRNLSTALMYSFAQRADTRVLDEPFYAHYLLQSGAPHPGREDVLQSLPHRVDAVFDLIEAADDRQVLFIKGMAKHLQDVPVDRLATMTSLFYIRDPEQIIASFAQVVDHPTMADIGLKFQAELFDAITSMGGKTLVLDSGDILADPDSVLQKLCNALDIMWDPAMRSWPAGPRPEDGVWAPYWYANVHQSTGFTRQSTSERPLPEHCEALLHDVMPFYERLHSKRITI